MNQITQGEAVYQAVSSVVDIDGKVELSDSQKREVYEIVFNHFKNGVTSHSGSPTDEQLRKYIPGLVNNWLRKDPRLNGGQKYVTKNPGSRAGAGDETLKAMKTLLSMTTDESIRAEIQREISARQNTLKPKTVVNVEALPPTLRRFVQS